MSNISWGKPKIWIATSNGTRPVNGSGWSLFPTPKEGTTQLTTTTGTKTEAKEEGGGLVDSRNQKSTFALECQVFVKHPTGSATTPSLPLTDDDGIITDNVALVLQPEDSSCIGIAMDYCSVTAETTYSVEDGILVKYTFNALVPTDSSKMVKLGVQTDPTTT